MADRRVGDIGEIELVDHILDILARGADSGECGPVRVGPGDDAAVLRCEGNVVLTTDSQHEGVHFRREWIEPEQLGRRAIAVNASDLGAMGASPTGFLVALAMPSETELDWVSALARGLCGGARRYGATIVGGDVAAVPGPLSINITAVGERSDDIGAGRAGARVGQRLLVTGWPGRAAAGRSLLQSGHEGGAAVHACVQAFLDPQPPVALGVAAAQRGLVAAMLDISDGVAIDLGRMCRASDVGARVDGDVLFADGVLKAAASDGLLDARGCVVGGGEDYELLCAIADADVGEFLRLAAEHDVETRVIGTVVDVGEGVTLSYQGHTEPLPRSGWDHFS
jgi:thiamine-monophosphate kinase